jgi:hypothetical protein
VPAELADDAIASPVRANESQPDTAPNRQLGSYLQRGGGVGRATAR